MMVGSAGGGRGQPGSAVLIGCEVDAQLSVYR